MSRKDPSGAPARRVAARVDLVVLVAVISLLVSGVPSASPTQMGAGDKPQKWGELALSAQKCGRRVEKKEGSDQVIGVGRSCLYFYQFDPADETDASNDHGIVWVQTTFDARNGYCARKVHSDVVLPAGVAHYSFVPAKPLETRQREAVTVKLLTNAQDQSSQKGVVRQEFILYPSTATAGVKQLKNDRNRFRLTWSGSSQRKLGFASGIQVSWDVVTGPPSEFNFGVSYAIADAC